MNNPSFIKSEYKKYKYMYGDALMLFRRGDFYFAYEDDAVTISQLLHINRWINPAGGNKETMFPFHSLDVYLPKMVRAGYRVLIFGAD